jgi:hypothetical protein
VRPLPASDGGKDPDRLATLECMATIDQPIVAEDDPRLRQRHTKFCQELLDRLPSLYRDVDRRLSADLLAKLGIQIHAYDRHLRVLG